LEKQISAALLIEEFLNKVIGLVTTSTMSAFISELSNRESSFHGICPKGV